MKVILIGRTEVLYNTALLIAERFEICGIITAKAVSEYERDENDFENLAEQLKCPFLLTSSINEVALQFIKDCKADIGVSVNWVSVIRENALKYIPLGILNCHPGNLPEYRGNAVCNWAMLRGDKNIVVTIHEMVPGELDSGDIYAQKIFEANSETTITDFIRFWKEETPQLFCEVIDGISTGTIKAIPQTEVQLPVFRCYPRLAIDSKIDWNKSAVEIHNLIRASSRPYSGAYTYLKLNEDIRKVIVWKSRVVQENSIDIGSAGHIIFNDRSTGESHIFTGVGILAITELQYEGESNTFLPGQTYKSIRMRFGIDIEQELIILRKLIYEKLG